MYLPGHFEPDTSQTAGPSSYNNARSSRRPWSPIHYDEDITDTRGIYDYYAQDHPPNSVLQAEQHGGRRWEASEGSVEALDLADYARTLRRPDTDRHSAYPPFPHTSHVHPFSVPTPVYANRLRASPQPHSFDSYPEYPPTPDNDRPFSALSRDTFSQAPPSLVSGDTSHDSHDSFGTPHRYPSRRPYSLPPFFASTSVDNLSGRGPAIFSATSGSPHHSLAHIPSPILEEADISRFPAFSRGWYDDPFKTAKTKHSSLPPYTSELQYDSHNSSKDFPSSASNQSRNLLPWSSQLSDVEGPAVDAGIKEERMRMLEREFGGKGKAGKEDPGVPVIGSVDEKGALITSGPKKRATARWAQGILALGAAVSSLYGALFIKPKTPAPPASKPPAFALYALSVITFFLVFYLFAIRPCCCGKRQKSDEPSGLGASGMMVLPVQGFPGGKKKKNKKGKKDKAGGGGGDVQVNLIVDPTMFGGGRRGRDEEYGSDEEYDDMDGSQVSSRRRGGRDQRQRRRGIFQGLTMESDWIAARKFLKRMLFLDIVCLVVWAGVFFLILLGKKCPPGGFSGWCDSYNIASAAACILCVAFGFSVFFDIMDLHKSKASPRTRT